MEKTIKDKMKLFFCLLVLIQYSLLYSTTSSKDDIYRKEIFTKYYNEKYWTFGQDFPVSGPGSTLKQTKKIRLALQKIINDYRVESMVDAPCGDFFWMKSINFPKGFKYTGLDIVKPLIQNNKNQYGTKNTCFGVLDVVRQIVPKVDLILCRDLFIHLSNEEIFQTLRNFKKSGSKYLLVSSYYIKGEAKKIKTGGFRRVNLQNPPFNLPKPILFGEESSTYRDGKTPDFKGFGLWKLSDLIL